MISDRALMEIHVSALYQHDARNRLLMVNEPEGDPPPRLFFGRTSTGNLWRFRHDLPEPLVDELEALLLNESVTDDLSHPPRCLADMEVVLTRHAPLSGTWSGAAWRSPDDLPSLPH